MLRGLRWTWCLRKDNLDQTREGRGERSEAEIRSSVKRDRSKTHDHLLGFMVEGERSWKGVGGWNWQFAP